MSTTKSPTINTAFFQLMKNPLKFRLFMLSKLPAAYFAGLRLVEATPEHCVVAVPFKWFTQNPFGSIYFACLSMAAEMSTGALAMAAIYKRPQKVSMLVVNIEAQFYKKAKGVVQFTCNDGVGIAAAVEETIATGEGTTYVAHAEGVNREGQIVAAFAFTWSFKAE